MKDDFAEELIRVIETSISFDDIEEIEKSFALFCSNYKVMPGSDEYEVYLDYLISGLGSRMNSNIIQKIRKLIDDYE